MPSAEDKKKSHEAITIIANDVIAVRDLGYVPVGSFIAVRDGADPKGPVAFHWFSADDLDAWRASLHAALAMLDTKEAQKFAEDLSRKDN